MSCIRFRRPRALHAALGGLADYSVQLRDSTPFTSARTWICGSGADLGLAAQNLLARQDQSSRACYEPSAPHKCYVSIPHDQVSVLILDGRPFRHLLLRPPPCSVSRPDLQHPQLRTALRPLLCYRFTSLVTKVWGRGRVGCKTTGRVELTRFSRALFR